MRSSGECGARETLWLVPRAVMTYTICKVYARRVGRGAIGVDLFTIVSPF